MKTCNAMGRTFDARVGLEVREERGDCGSLWTGRGVPSHLPEKLCVLSGAAGVETRAQPADVGGLVTRTANRVA